MRNSQRSHQAGFSRVDAGLLLIVAFLALLVSYVTDRIFRGGENMKHLLEWFEETNAQLRRGVTTEQLHDLLGTNLHSKADWEFMAIAGAGFALVLALLLAVVVVRRISHRRATRQAKAKQQQGRRAGKILHTNKRWAA